MVNGTLSSNTSSNSRDTKREIELLNREVNNIFAKLADIERSERQVLGEKKEAINTLARIYEHLHQLGEYKEPLDTICAYICKQAVEKGLLASGRWIHEVMENKYKQVKFDPTVNKEEDDIKEGVREMWQAAAGGIEFSLEQPEVSSQYTDDYNINKIAQKSIDELTDREEIRIATQQELKKAEQFKSIARETAKRADVLLEKCDRMKIAIDPEVRGVDPIPVVSATSDYSGPGLFSNALLRYSEVIRKAVPKVEKYKPSPELDAKFAEAIEAMIAVWRPWVDEKYRKDTFSWLHVAMDKAAHGKHAAATMHATLFPDGTKRALTREQVGDKDELVLQQAMRILAVWKDLEAMHRWSYELPEKAIAKRAKKLNKRLSNSA